MSGRTAAVGPSPFETRFALLRVTDQECASPISELSRQLALAPGPQPFFGLELRHSEQMIEHLKPVALRQFDQFGHSFGDERNGLVRAALPTTFIGWRPRSLPEAVALPRRRQPCSKNLHPIAHSIAQK
jgi:hypothetical protein